MLWEGCLSPVLKMAEGRLNQAACEPVRIARRAWRAPCTSKVFVQTAQGNLDVDLLAILLRRDCIHAKVGPVVPYGFIRRGVDVCSAAPVTAQ